jgi:protein gp37
MSANSKIEWTDHTFNPWEGCTKVSPGCANCYAETLVAKRYQRVKWGKGQPRRRTSEANWKEPLKWNRVYACGKCGVCDGPGNRTGSPCACGAAIGFQRPRVFCASLADWLDDEVPIEWFIDLLQLIYRTPNLDWLLLTKRPQHFFVRTLEAALSLVDSHRDEGLLEWLVDWSKEHVAPPNIWVGTSVEDQKRADERIPHLLGIPARVRFLSMEPLLEDVELFTDAQDPPNSAHAPDIDWVILGGESGPGARVCSVEWIRQIVQLCQFIPVPVFVKQLGSRPVTDIQDARGGYLGFKGLDLNDRKGGDMSEWPEDLRVREFPPCAAQSQIANRKS